MFSYTRLASCILAFVMLIQLMLVPTVYAIATVADGPTGVVANQAGNGSYLSAPTVTQSFTVNAVVPGVPTVGSATAGDTMASVSFLAPGSNGGAAITGYTITASPGGATGTGASSPVTVTGLTNGVAYTFTVTATNSVGTGPASASSNSIIPKASQTITFNNPGAQNFGTTPTLTTTATSGLTPTFSSRTTGVCTITSGGSLTFMSAGTCTIGADQAGNDIYLAAPTVTQSFTVNAVVPGVPTVGSATAGDTMASVSFLAPGSNGGAAITGYTITASPGGATGTGASSPVTVTGLTNGVAYTFTVTATNSVGTGSASASSNSIIPKASQTITFANPGAQNFGTTPTLTATATSGLTPTFSSLTSGVCMITSGGALSFISSGTCTIGIDQAGNGSYLTAPTVTQSFTVNPVVPVAPPVGSVSFLAPVSNIIFKPVIDQNGVLLDPATINLTQPSVTLETTSKGGVAYVSIPSSILTSFKGKNDAFIIEIKTKYGSYQVPADLASHIPGLADLLVKNNLKDEDISFKIILTDKSSNKDIQDALVSGLPNGKLMGAVVDFHIDIVNTKTGQTIGTVNKFSKPLNRVIAMPTSITSMPEQWGSFRYNETAKKFEFVPAYKIQINGVWYVKIHSYSNSTYVVVQNTVSFTDTLKHWGNTFIQTATAKGLVEGTGGGMYGPDQSVTRAEFTAMLVRALGRGTGAGTGDLAPFDDVKQGTWYYGEVAVAKELGLLDFANGKNLKPNQPLTREEMASMLEAMVKLERLPVSKENVSLDDFKDAGSIDAVYVEGVRLMVKLHIMTGVGAKTFSPKSETTRTQAAVVLIRSLQTLGMLDD